jgi:hypothetical protein
MKKNLEGDKRLMRLISRVMLFPRADLAASAYSYLSTMRRLCPPRASITSTTLFSSVQPTLRASTMSSMSSS